MKPRKPLKVNLDKLKAWKLRSMQKAWDKTRQNHLKQLAKPSVWHEAKIKHIKQRTNKRAKEEAIYRSRIGAFIDAHPICPVTGNPATEVHHSCGRVGGYLLLERYWIAVSREGHNWIHRNSKQAEKIGLMIRIRLTYDQHCAKLLADGESLSDPVFYRNRSGKTLVNEKSKI